jgi:uncharacterized membrane protein YqjE
MGQDEAGVAHDPAMDGSTETPPRPEGSIKATVQRLIESGKEVVHTELAWARLKGLSAVAIMWRVLVFAGLGLACLIVGVALLLVSMIVALAPVIGLFLAVLSIALLALIAAFLFGFKARRTLGKIFDEDEA